MILSKDIPEKIDVFEYLLPKLQLMTMPPSFEGDKRLPEVRFINFLQELSIDSDKIKELEKNIEQWNIKTAHEFDLMKRRADGFLEMYATDYNKYFKTTKNYQTQASRMQAFMAKLYTIFTDTSKKERAKAYDEDFNRIFHSAFENSPLNAPHIEATWFDLNSLTMEAKLLFSHLQNLFLNLQKMFEYAQNVDNLVEGLRKDRKRIVAIFNKCNQKKKKDLKLLMGAFSLTYLEPIFPEITNDLNSMNFEDFIVKYYHELNEQEFTCVVPLYHLILQKYHNINPDESNLYDDIYDINTKIELVKKLRVVMKHISEFDIKGNKERGKDTYLVSSKFIAMLMMEIKIPSGKGKEFVEEYFKKHYEGKFTPVKYGAVNAAYGKIDKNGDEYKAFHKKVEDLANRENNREEANNKLVTENKQETKMVPVFSQQSQMLFNSITKN